MARIDFDHDLASFLPTPAEMAALDDRMIELYYESEMARFSACSVVEGDEAMFNDALARAFGPFSAEATMYRKANEDYQYVLDHNEQAENWGGTMIDMEKDHEVVFDLLRPRFVEAATQVHAEYVARLDAEMAALAEEAEAMKADLRLREVA